MITKIVCPTTLSATAFVLFIHAINLPLADRPPPHSTNNCVTKQRNFCLTVLFIWRCQLSIIYTQSITFTY
uniref:Secreted protein n=1 Tax=Globodera rostochiensis TaxID=31243 RepID=A0A914IBH0_GLORO